MPVVVDTNETSTENTVSMYDELEELLKNGTLRQKSKREKLLDPAYIDRISRMGEVFIKFRDDIIVPSSNLNEIKSTLNLRYFSINGKSDEIKYTWKVQSLKSKSAVIKIDFENPLLVSNPVK